MLLVVGCTGAGSGDSVTTTQPSGSESGATDVGQVDQDASPQSEPREGASSRDEPLTDVWDGWQRVPNDARVFGTGQHFAGPGMWDVAAAGPGFVAVGIWVEGGIGSEGAIWTSVDGYSWQRQQSSDSDGFGLSLTSVAVAEDGTVVVAGATQTSMPAVWVSSDGVSWEPGVGGWGLGDGETAGLSAIAHVDGRFVAIGRVVPSQIHGVWESPDGRVWERVSVPEGTFTDGDTVSAVSIVGSRLLAAGYAFGPPDVPTVWSSSDGRAWERTTLSGIQDAQLHDVASYADGAVVVGAHRQDANYLGSSQGAVWLSSDGAGWSLSEADLSSSQDSTTDIWSVTSTSQGLLAAGSDGGIATIWVSEDGESWKTSLQQGWQDLDAEAVPWRAISGVAEGTTGMVAVGQVSHEPGYNGTTAAVWVR